MGSKTNYIVELAGKEWWLSTWNGDPGRTLVRENAKRFKTKTEATRALERVIKKWPKRLDYTTARIVAVYE